MTAPSSEECEPTSDFDYSSPEAIAAMQAISDLVLEIRAEHTGPITRKIRLYERTLGLAVIPVLLRRAAIMLARKIRQRSRSTA